MCKALDTRAASDFGTPYYEPARRLYRYWGSLVGTKPRKALSPLAIGAPLLPHASLARVLDGGADVRYELIGAALHAAAPRLKPGALASDPLRVDPANRLIFDRLTGAARAQRPLAFRAWFKALDGRPRALFTLVLPLGLDPDAPASSDLLIGVWPLPGGERTARSVHPATAQDVTQAFLASAA
ncbi:MAG: hypothetical protein NXI21_18890 [Alphaproteobacteria bacterium]|nr:hypothetical protein [Alphaproteobacteria bacterium]